MIRRGRLPLPCPHFLGMQALLLSHTGCAWQSRHEQLEAQTQARSHLYERAMEALEAQTRELRDTRAALQRSEAEADSLRTQAERALQAEADARDARDEARRIEDRLHEALTSPFFQEGDDRCVGLPACVMISSVC